jgi:hypothetical protein|tara:strand:- start:1013 stop:1603 length:591 start_codon:yes stop_codon:yes gene_type:complete
MSLSLAGSNGSSSEGYMGNGVYVDEVQIKKVSDVTSKETERGFKRDISIALKVLVLKNDWERTVTIGGNYKRDPITKEVTDWGGAFKLKDLFIACGLTDKDMDEEIDANGVPSSKLLDRCVSHNLKTLTYTNVKGKYSTWNSVTGADRDSVKFKEYFMSQVAKGYPKNYQAPGGESQPVNATIAQAVNSNISSEAL